MPGREAAYRLLGESEWKIPCAPGSVLRSSRIDTRTRAHCASAAACRASWPARQHWRRRSRGRVRTGASTAPATATVHPRCSGPTASWWAGGSRRLESLPAVHVRSGVAVVAERLRHGECRSLSRARAAGTWSGLERALRGDARRRAARAGALGRARARRRRLPDGREVARRAQARPAATNSRSRTATRAIRARSSTASCSRPIPHARARGTRAVRLRDRRAARNRLRALRVPARGRSASSARSTRRAARASSAARILGSDFDFDVRVARGEGSYVCGEETALLDALEGERGEVRLRPPYPTEHGLFGAPTVVNNVETLVNAAWIARRGAEAYRALGTRAVAGHEGSLARTHGFARPGHSSRSSSAPRSQSVDRGASRGHAARRRRSRSAAPMGSVLPRDEWDVPICSFEALERARRRARTRRARRAARRHRLRRARAGLARVHGRRVVREVRALPGGLAARARARAARRQRARSRAARRRSPPTSLCPFGAEHPCAGPQAARAGSAPMSGARAEIDGRALEVRAGRDDPRRLRSGSASRSRRVCQLPGHAPDGGCRAVPGRGRGLAAPAAARAIHRCRDGMRVRTQTPRARAPARRGCESWHEAARSPRVAADTSHPYLRSIPRAASCAAAACTSARTSRVRSCTASRDAARTRGSRSAATTASRRARAPRAARASRCVPTGALERSRPRSPRQRAAHDPLDMRLLRRRLPGRDRCRRAAAPCGASAASRGAE